MCSGGRPAIEFARLKYTPTAPDTLSTIRSVERADWWIKEPFGAGPLGLGLGTIGMTSQARR